MTNKDKYAGLKAQLELEEWPGVFYFKFIIPNDPRRVALVSALFDEGTELRMQPSRNDKYISISAKELMLNADQVLEKYLKADKIEGLIAL